MPKERKHNEHFRTVFLRGRKTCPTCSQPIGTREAIWSWGEYVNAKWRTVMHFCKNCFVSNVQGPLTEHTKNCGCTVELVGYRCELPDWLTLKK